MYFLGIRTLSTAEEPAQRRLLCELHFRWWHAPAATMKPFPFSLGGGVALYACTKHSRFDLLKHAGAAQAVLDLIHQIVDTCNVCRKWAKPQPDSVASTALPERFNDQVECDLMFYKKYIILHLACRCIRWQAAKVAPDEI